MSNTTPQGAADHALNVQTFHNGATVNPSSQGTPNTSANAWPTKITDGTTNAAVKAASTAPLASDTALVVCISPNSALTTFNPSVGATGSAVPSSGTFMSASDGTNLVGLRVGAQVSAASLSVVLASNQATVPVSGTFFQATQPVSGTFFQATQPVSGTITANIGTAGTLALDATLTGGTARSKITDGTNNAAIKAASTAAVAADPALVVAISPNNTVAVSAASLPLPTGASTETTLAAIKAKTDNLDVALSTRAVTGLTDTQLRATPVPVSGTVTAANASVSSNGAAAPASSTQIGATDGTNLLAARMKAASTAAVAADPALVVAISPNNTIPVSGPLTDTQLRATAVPISGTVTANAGTNLNTSALALDVTLTGGTARSKITDGTTNVAVKAASTAAVAVDPALVVAISPNNTVAVSAASLPLPSGASTETTLALIKAKTDNLDVALSTRAVTGLTDAQIRATPLPVSGTVTAANASVSTNGAAAPASSTQLGATDGTNLLAARMKGASTAAVATDPALVVAISPNNTIPVSAASLPLPSGASTETTLALIKAKTDNLDVALSTRAITGLTDTQLRATAVPVSGTVTANAGTNLNTSALALDATFTGGTARTKVTDGTTNAAVKAASTAAVAADPAFVVAISPNNTVAVSAAALPLPSGASTEATLALIKAKTDNLDVALSTRAVTGLTDAQIRATPLPVSGTVTANAGTNLNTSALALDATLTGGTTRSKITDGTTNAAVKAASTAAVAADPAFVVAISPNNTPVLPSGASTEATLALIKAKTDNLDVALSTRAITGLTDTQLRATAVPVSGPLTDTQIRATALPVSAASLPLPTGASTSALQTTGNTSLGNIDTKLPAALVGGRLDGNMGAWLGSTVPTVGQKAMASCLPVAIASDQGALTVSVTAPVSDRTASGTITAVNGTVAMSAQGCGVVAIQSSGVWVATLVIEGTVDGTTWLELRQASVGFQPQAILTSNSIWRVAASGMAQVRVRASAFTSGTATITLEGSSGSSITRAIMEQYVFTSTLNSSTANLAASAVFTGAAESTLGAAGIQINFKADQACTVQCQQSIDGTNWDFADSYSVAASTGDGRTIQATSSFFRVLVTNNGGSTTTFLRLQANLCPVVEAVPRALGQTTMARSMAVTIASDQAAVSVSGTNKATYSAVTASFTPAAAATDIFVITGSATKTVKVVSVTLSGTQTTAGNIGSISMIKRSADDTAGTSAAATRVPMDSANAAATAVVRSYTANPTLGTAVGTVFQPRMDLPAPATAISPATIFQYVAPHPLTGQPLTLRGAAEVIAINMGGGTLPTGAATFQAEVVWTEE